MPRMEPVEFRCPVELRNQAQQQAERRGISFSEFCRSSLAFTLAWTTAIDTVRAGGSPDHLTDLEHLATILGKITTVPDS